MPLSPEQMRVLDRLNRLREAGRLNESQLASLNAIQRNYALDALKRMGRKGQLTPEQESMLEAIPRSKGATYNKISAFGRGALKEAAFSFHDEIGGIIIGTLNPDIGIAEATDLIRAKDDIAEAEEGGAFLGGQVAGATGSVLLPGGALFAGTRGVGMGTRAALGAAAGSTTEGTRALGAAEGGLRERVDDPNFPIATGAGALFGAAAPYVGDAAAQGFRRIAPRIGAVKGFSREATNLLLIALDRSKDPKGQSFAEVLGNLGPEAIPADLGQGTREAAAVISSLTSAGRTLRQTVEGRAAGAQGRVAEDLQELGPAGAAGRARTGIDDARKKLVEAYTTVLTGAGKLDTEGIEQAILKATAEGGPVVRRSLKPFARAVADPDVQPPHVQQVRAAQERVAATPAPVAGSPLAPSASPEPPPESALFGGGRAAPEIIEGEFTEIPGPALLGGPPQRMPPAAPPRPGVIAPTGVPPYASRSTAEALADEFDVPAPRPTTPAPRPPETREPRQEQLSQLEADQRRVMAPQVRQRRTVEERLAEEAELERASEEARRAPKLSKTDMRRMREEIQEAKASGLEGDELKEEISFIRRTYENAASFIEGDEGAVRLSPTRVSNLRADLSSEARRLERTGKAEQAAQLQPVLEEFTRTLDEGVPGYAKVRGRYADVMKRKRAVNLGAKAMVGSGRKVSGQEVQEAFNAMTPKERRYFVAGLRESLDEAESPNLENYRTVIRILGRPKNVALLRRILPRGGASRLLRRARSELEFELTRRATERGARTGARAAIREGVKPRERDIIGSALGMGMVRRMLQGGRPGEHAGIEPDYVRSERPGRAPGARIRGQTGRRVATEVEQFLTMPPGAARDRALQSLSDKLDKLGDPDLKATIIEFLAEQGTRAGTASTLAVGVN